MATPDPLTLFLAGSLTTLAPCVLPALPMVVNSSLRRAMSGPIVLVAGMAVAFTLISAFLPTLMREYAIDRNLLRMVASMALIVSGLFLLIRLPQKILEWLCTDRPGVFELTFIRSSVPEMTGLFMVGMALGFIWNPCSGGSLGSLMDLSRQPGGAFKTAPYFLIFGIGAAVPLVIFAALVRFGCFVVATVTDDNVQGNAFEEGDEAEEYEQQNRDNLFACLLMSVGTMVMTNYDKYWEARLLRSLPEWVIQIQGLI
jgi:cytochrome c-type biogenesis protein